jgi:outer membrane receptor for ferric coprogen and ferric-rhodotorulic acid
VHTLKEIPQSVTVITLDDQGITDLRTPSTTPPASSAPKASARAWW